MSRDAAGRAIVVLNAGGYRGPAIDGDLVELWTSELSSFDDEVLDAASHEWATTAGHFPTLGEFLVACRFEKRKILAKTERQLSRESDRGRELTPEENLAHIRAARRHISSLTGPLFGGSASGVVPTPPKEQA